MWYNITNKKGKMQRITDMDEHEMYGKRINIPLQIFFSTLSQSIKLYCDL